MTPQKFKTFIEKELDELHAIDTIYLDIKKISTIADGMWITTGRSRRHTQAIAENIMEKLKASEAPAMSISGYDNAEWILIDCGNYLIHIMMPAIRDTYRLEDLWKKPEKSTEA